MILTLQIIQYLLNRYFNVKLKKLIFGNGGKNNGLLLVNDFKSKNFFIDFWRIGKKIIPPLNILFLID